MITRLNGPRRYCAAFFSLSQHRAACLQGIGEALLRTRTEGTTLYILVAYLALTHPSQCFRNADPVSKRRFREQVRISG